MRVTGRECGAACAAGSWDNRRAWILNADSELVELVAQFLMEQEFLFARGRLESEGIECFCPTNTSAGSAAASITG